MAKTTTPEELFKKIVDELWNGFNKKSDFKEVEKLAITFLTQAKEQWQREAWERSKAVATNPHIDMLFEDWWRENN